MSEGERRLLGILFTDIVGYTALLGADEAKGIEARQEHARLIRTLASQFHGEFVDESGDASLSIFPSAVDAVKCAMAVQAVLAAEPTFQVRIGIHVGDVVERDGRPVGDAINVASRLPALAEAGGIVATDAVVEQVRNQRIATTPLGERMLKNVAKPVAVFAVGAGAGALRPDRRVSRRIAVLGSLLAALGLLAGYFFLGGGREELLVAAVLHGYLREGTQYEQELAFATTSDGVRIAYATTGNADGPPLVIVLGWITHLERGLFSPGLNFVVQPSLLERHRIVLYDGRGTGLSDRDIDDFSLDAKVRDLEAVVEAAGLDRFAIYAVSAGGPTSVAYAVRHPERVTRIAFYGSFLWMGGVPGNLERWKTFPALVRVSWGEDNPAFRQLFTTLFMPEGDEMTMRFFNELQKVSATPEDAAGFIGSLGETDVRELAPRIRAPVLVAHRSGDQIVPYGLGREIAALIPSARLVTLEGVNHAYLASEREAIGELGRAMTDFLAQDGSSDAP
jgi:class 3 adenylate cyclase/pimeloyl-ACP methyl ester carboxylesterase